MNCPNKNDSNWKLLEKHFGEIGAFAIFSEIGVPDILNHPYYSENKGEVNESTLILDTVASIKSSQLQDVDMLPDFKDESSRNNAIIDSKNSRLRSARADLNRAKEKNDLKKVAVLTDMIQKLEDDVEKLEKDNTIQTVIDHGKKDLLYVDRILNKKNISTGEMTAALRILRLWMGAPGFMSPEEGKELSEYKKELDSVAGDAMSKDKELAKIIKDNVEKFTKDNLGVDEITTLSNDISRLKGYTLSLDHVNDDSLRALYTSVKKANVKAREEATQIMEKLNGLMDPLKKKFGSEAAVYDLLMQKYADGTDTGNLITKVSADYEQEKFNRRNDFLQYKGKDEAALMRAKKEYTEWVSQNEMVMDTRKLFGDMKGREEHIEELKSILGETEFERRYEMLKKKYERYQESKKAYEDYYKATYGKSEVEGLMKIWELENSPDAYMDFIENYRNPKFKGIKVSGYEYTYSVPKNKSAFDPRYAVLEKSENKDLLEYYNTIRDTLSKLYDILPVNQRDQLKSNGIPYIEKSIAEQYNDQGFRHASNSIMAELKKSILAGKESEMFTSYQDPITNEVVDELKAPDLNDRTRINEIFRLKLIEYRKNTGTRPTQSVRNELYKASQQEVAGKKSKNLNKVIGAYALMLKAYEHKSKIEDQVNLLKHEFNTRREDMVRKGVTKKDKEGVAKLGPAESFIVTKEVLGNHLDTVFYDKGQQDEYVFGDKVYTAEEKKEKERLEGLLETEDLSENERSLIGTKLAGLGGRKSGSKIGNSALKFIQLKGMGLNLPAAVTNMQFGFISNWVHAAGSEDYTLSEMSQAQTLVMNTVLGKTTKNGKKIVNTMKKLDVLKDSTSEITNTNTRLEKYAYILTEKTEKMNQAPIMIAMLKNAGVWEDIDENGNYTGDKDFDMEKFKLKLDQVVKMLHGNYDPDSPLLIKRYVLGRMMSQFRTWMFESVNNRFQAGEYDPILERYKKGRYATVKDLFTKGDFKLTHLLLYPLVKGFYQAVRTDLNTLEGEARADAANMRKNLAELVGLMTTMAAMGSLFLLAGGDDEDENEAYEFAINYAVNNLNRVAADITFYVNPVEAENILQHIIPATSLVDDGINAFTSLGGLLFGEDEYERGIYAGQSKAAKAWGTLIPGVTQGYKLYSLGNQIYNK
jgi:hypothetical protein